MELPDVGRPEEAGPDRALEQGTVRPPRGPTAVATGGSRDVEETRVPCTYSGANVCRGE